MNEDLTPKQIADDEATIARLGHGDRWLRAVSDMPGPRPYDRRIPPRNPAGRSCNEFVLGVATVVTVFVMALAGCGPANLNNPPLTPIPAPAVTR